MDSSGNVEDRLSIALKKLSMMKRGYKQQQGELAEQQTVISHLRDENEILQSKLVDMNKSMESHFLSPISTSLVRKGDGTRVLSPSSQEETSRLTLLQQRITELMGKNERLKQIYSAEVNKLKEQLREIQQESVERKERHSTMTSRLSLRIDDTVGKLAEANANMQQYASFTRPLAQRKVDEVFRARLLLPDFEFMITSASVTGFGMKGTMYVTPQYVCFEGNSTTGGKDKDKEKEKDKDGGVFTRTLAYRSMAAVQKASDSHFSSSRSGGSSILLILLKGEHVLFSNIKHRDDLFEEIVFQAAKFSLKLDVSIAQMEL